MVNLLPIIGILCIDIDFDVRKEFGTNNEGKNNTYYISSEYVKWLEGAGAKVIPIWANQTEEHYKDIMNKINGILFPGGQFYFNDEKYGKAAYSARKIYDIAVNMNEKGNYFPIWGTCLGQQLLVYAASGGQTNSRKLINPINANLPLKFESNYRDSKMFHNVPDDIYELMKTKPVMYNAHKYIVTKNIMENYGQTNNWNIIAKEIYFNQIKNQSTTESQLTKSEHELDSNDTIEFAATLEHTKYPFYGVISHPQKIQFADNSDTIPHNLDAIRVSQYFANFFVEECRKNKNTFDDSNDEIRHLIYNYPITFIKPKLSKFTQCYLFNDETNYPEKSKDFDVKH